MINIRMQGVFEDVIDCKRILRELRLLRFLKHPNLLGIIEIIKPTDLKRFDEIYVVTEFC